MINDYKSFDDLRTLDGPRRRRGFAIPALLGTTLCILGAYASHQFFNLQSPGDSGNPVAAKTEISSSPATPRALKEESEPALPSAEQQQIQQEIVSLALPSIEQSEEAFGEEETEPFPGSTTLAMEDLPVPVVTAAPDETSLPVETDTPRSATIAMENLPAPAMDAAPDEIPLPVATDTPESAPIAKDTPDGAETQLLADQEIENAQPPEPTGKWVEEKVGKGDSLARIFSGLNLSANLLHRIVHSSKEAKELASIKPDELLRVRLTDEGGFLELEHKRSPINSLHITPDGDSFQSRVVLRELEKRTARATGTIENSLYESAKESGLSDTLVMELANIFGWDIDFALEIRSGDRFSLIYEEKYLDGQKYRNGAILAAEFVNRGRIFRAVRYENEHGEGNYYSPDGKSMRKAFLRAPVDFRRISSRFKRERWHPVLGKKRPHRGVDYAAATGTPIKAAGDGKVIFRGRKGGYGRTIIVQHANRYTTLYAHLSKYRRTVKNGSRVKQGQTIGYVGRSGLATGPHLHYEFRVNGAHRNPLKIKLPAASPIAKKYREDFRKQSQPLLSQLDLISRTMVADASTVTP
jgi:murein DD-endopeptidase MepM/ murein hydrolase activator NlpD